MSITNQPASCRGLFWSPSAVFTWSSVDGDINAELFRRHIISQTDQTITEHHKQYRKLVLRIVNRDIQPVIEPRNTNYLFLLVPWLPVGGWIGTLVLLGDQTNGKGRTTVAPA